MRLTATGLMALTVLCASVHATEYQYQERDMPESADEHYRRYIEKMKAQSERLANQRAELRTKVQDELKKQSDIRKNDLEPLATSTVTVDEETLQVTEPPSMEKALSVEQISDEYEVSGQDFNLYEHERWALHKNDFRFDKPMYIVGETRQGHTQSWFAIPYSITNSTTKPRRIAPVFVAVTNNGVFTPQSGGFLPQSMISESMLRPLAFSTKAQDNLWLSQYASPVEDSGNMHSHGFTDGKFSKVPTPPKPMATFAPGQTRWGVALWPNFNDEFTELKIVVHGLNNAIRYDRKQRRVLVMTFNRNDDEFHVHRSRLKYAGKEWEYLWMWEQDINVPIPEDAKDPQIKEKNLGTPAGGQRLLWSFPFVITNSTPNDQTLKVKDVRFVLRGAKNGLNWSGFNVEVDGKQVTIPEIPVVDDGRSNIYKAQYLRELGKSDPSKERHRFAPNPEKAREEAGRVYTIRTGEKVEGWSVLDQRDIDWTYVRFQVESALTLAADKQELSQKRWKELVDKYGKDAKDLAEKNPGFLYDPVRRLSDDTVATADGRTYHGVVIADTEDVVIIDTEDEGRQEIAKKDATVTLGEFSAVKKQINDQVAAALAAAKASKTVVAYFTCESGLSSGSYRISRSYRQRGVIQEEWLKAWESLDNAQ